MREGLFRCPHCRERAIGVWAKLKANGFRPSQCSQCGGKYVPATWGTLLALVAFLVALAAPFLVAGSATVTLAWMLLAAGVALGLAASMLAYLLATPLLRHRSRAARWDWWSYVAAIAAVSLYALLSPSPASEPGFRDGEKRRMLFEIRPDDLPPGYMSGSQSVWYADPALQEELKAALAKAGVPFTLEMQDGKEHIRVRNDRLMAFKRVERELWGEPPPTDGRSVHFPDPAVSREFRKWLSDSAIAHRVVTYQGRDYIAWDGEPHLFKKFFAQRPSDCPRAQLDAPKRC